MSNSANSKQRIAKKIPQDVEQYRLEVKSILDRYHKLSDENINTILKIAYIRKFKSNEHIIGMNKKARISGFIINGFAKARLFDNDGSERIFDFLKEGDFVANCESYSFKTASKYDVSALKDTELLMFDNETLETLCAQNHELSIIAMRLTQELVFRREEHSQILSLKKPSDRYTYIVENKPHLLQKTNLTEISKYLNMSRETVSRCRLYLLNQLRLKYN